MRAGVNFEYRSNNHVYFSLLYLKYVPNICHSSNFHAIAIQHYVLYPGDLYQYKLDYYVHREPPNK